MFKITAVHLFIAHVSHTHTHTQVIASFVSLGRQAQTNGFQGPVLGPKTAEANPREFDELQQKQIRSEIGLQMGTNKVASQAGQTPYGFQRQIHDKRNNK